jgi:glycolate oxidase FAD binding subunit
MGQLIDVRLNMSAAEETAAARSVAEDFRSQVLEASKTHEPLRIRGGGSKDWYGSAKEGRVLDTRSYRGIVSYDAAELVVTARCGTPLAEVEELLASNDQMLPFEPPHFGPDATFGGCIAAGISGPRRANAGAVRDFVLGASVMTGRGDILKFGGEVMKNVAGYDVARLMAGSLGCLGLLMDISVKVLPRPVASVTLRFDVSLSDAIRNLNEWGGKALPISASAWQDGILTIRLEGAVSGVRSACAQLGGVPMDEPAAEFFWRSIKEQTSQFFDGRSSQATLWRISVPSTTEASALPEYQRQLIEWGGSQRWLLSEDGDISVRKAAVRAYGHATQFRNPTPGSSVFTAISAPLMDIHKRLKAAFDPAGVFNPGRMFAEM